MIRAWLTRLLARDRTLRESGAKLAADPVIAARRQRLEERRERVRREAEFSQWTGGAA